MQPFRIAVIATAYYAVSHADVMVTRWLEPLPDDPEWGWPGPAGDRKTEIASIYLRPSAERPPGHVHTDVGAKTMARFGVPMFDSIRAALTLGGDQLAVDGVLLIAEHGDFPTNEFGQKLYPRYEYWREIVDVMRESGRIIPIFLDKHLSYDNAKALEMVRVTRELGIPMMAGSSLPHCKMSPDLEVKPGARLDEVMTMYFCGPEVYGFHILDVLQSIIEKRQGGESGVARVMALTGSAVWQAANPDMIAAGLEVARGSRTGNLQDNCPEPLAFLVEHADGLKATHLYLDGHINDWIVVIRDQSGIRAARVDTGDATNFYAHFATLNRRIEDFFLHGTISAPLERTLLGTLLISDLMHALHSPGEWIDVSAHAVTYDASGVIGAEWPKRA